MEYGMFSMPLRPPGGNVTEDFHRDVEGFVLGDRLGYTEGWMGEHFTIPWEPMPAADIMLAGTGMAVLAGAQLSVIDEEFAEGMGVEPGVLVLRVPRGTPASDAGLRPGDVIRALDGMPLRDMLPLRKALGNPGVRQVKLTVNSKGAAPRIVTLRW